MRSVFAAILALGIAPLVSKAAPAELPGQISGTVSSISVTPGRSLVRVDFYRTPRDGKTAGSVAVDIAAGKATFNGAAIKKVSELIERIAGTAEVFIEAKPLLGKFGVAHEAAFLSGDDPPVPARVALPQPEEDKWLVKDYESFYILIQKGFRGILVVGIEDRWGGKGWMHCRVPSGFRSLGDGCYDVYMSGGRMVFDKVYLRLAVNAAEEVMHVKPHELARLNVEGVDPKAAIIWNIFPSEGVDRATTSADRLEFVAPPGSYKVQLLVISPTEGGGIKADQKWVTVVFEGAVPPKDGGRHGKLDPWNAVGKLRTDEGGCSGTFIGPRRADGKWDVLSASHCFRGVGSKATMTLRDGRVIPITCVVWRGPWTEDADIAWCVTDEPVESVPYALVSPDNPKPGVVVWHGGFGVDVPGNREEGEVDDIVSLQLRFMLSVSPGDSGGGIFRNDTGELVSCVCCTEGFARKTRTYGASTTEILASRPAAPPAPPRHRERPNGPIRDLFKRWLSADMAPLKLPIDLGAGVRPVDEACPPGACSPTPAPSVQEKVVWLRALPWYPGKSVDWYPGKNIGWRPGDLIGRIRGLIR